MSRSYKKTPCLSLRTRWAKKEANKKVRRVKDVPNGKQYRKLYDLWWDDYNSTYFLTWKEYWAEQIQDWKRKDEYRLGGYPRGYYADWRFFSKKYEGHWSRQNPELHKEKHYAFWKKNYKCK